METLFIIYDVLFEARIREIIEQGMVIPRYTRIDGVVGARAAEMEAATSYVVDRHNRMIVAIAEAPDHRADRAGAEPRCASRPGTGCAPSSSRRPRSSRSSRRAQDHGTPLGMAPGTNLFPFPRGTFRRRLCLTRCG